MAGRATVPPRTRVVVRPRLTSRGLERGGCLLDQPGSCSRRSAASCAHREGVYSRRASRLRRPGHSSTGWERADEQSELHAHDEGESSERAASVQAPPLGSFQLPGDDPECERCGEPADEGPEHHPSPNLTTRRRAIFCQRKRPSAVIQLPCGATPLPRLLERVTKATLDFLVARPVHIPPEALRSRHLSRSGAKEVSKKSVGRERRVVGRDHIESSARSPRG